MKPIALFYHALFFMDSPDNLLERAVNIVHDQMQQAEASGLIGAASEIHVGLNGGLESQIVGSMVLPPQAKVELHGLQCHTENRTLLMLERWLPGHEDWCVLYFHAKGSTSSPEKRQMGDRWRGCMTRHCVLNWRKCVAALDEGYDVAGVHYMCPPATPTGQHIMAGNWWWSRASYLLTLPTIMLRDRIKTSGLDSVESRYESEVWLGNGPRLPKIKDFHPDWNPGKIGSCR